MKYIVKYDPIRDKVKVMPNGALDLKSAYANNSIPANVSVKDSQFNGIKDPNAIYGRVKDSIDAEVMAATARGYKPPKNEESKTE